ncbi:4-hydroxybenzoate 3-monooxygenase [Colwellia sp. RE-S-Sl-9]
MKKLNTKVVIIGSGPAGLFLGQLLQNQGIDNIIIDNKSQDYILGRIRAGVLEQSTVNIVREAGVNQRMDHEGLIHEGFTMVWGNDNQRQRIPFTELTNGKIMMVYGQTELTKDFLDARNASDAISFYDAENVTPDNIYGDTPTVRFTHNGEEYEVSCDYIAGCDGYHGVSRQSVPREEITEYEYAYPFGWLGILADVPPVSHEVLYQHHEDGYVLCSMRSKTRSRYYIQVPLDEKIEDWSADRFWTELKRRLPDDIADKVVTGPALEMSIAPLRSFVCEPLRFGNLFLVGDAAHIVPPTGAKGLNLAASDAKELFDALVVRYQKNDASHLAQYSAKALDRIWKAERFSWSMTKLFHRLDENPITMKMQLAEISYLASSKAGQTTIAENFVGLD